MGGRGGGGGGMSYGKACNYLFQKLTIDVRERLWNFEGPKRYEKSNLLTKKLTYSIKKKSVILPI